MSNLSIVHYIITVIFFVVLVIATLLLSQTLQTMYIPENDPTAQSAKNTLAAAVSLGWITEIIIVVGLIYIGIIGFRGGFGETTQQLKSITGSDKLFVSLRVIVFSILVLVSLIMGVLCFTTN
jgi:hypothetical protein